MAATDEHRKQALVLSRVGRVRRRLNRDVWLERLVAPAWCMAAALAVWRVVFHAHTPWAAAILAAGGLAWWVGRTRGRRVSMTQASVLSDRLAGAGGLLLTRLEVPVGEWELWLNQKLRDLPLPPARSRRHALAALAAAAFVALVLSIPEAEVPAHGPNAAAATKVAELEAKAEALAEEKPLDDAARAELERLREEALQDQFDAKDWEAADGLESRMNAQAAEASAELARADEAAKALEQALAKAQTGDDAAREREELERALSSLSKPGATAKSGDGGVNGDDNGKASTSDVRKALAQRQQQLAQRFQQKGDGESGGTSSGKGESQVASGEGEDDDDGDGASPAHGPGKSRLRFGPMPELHPERLQFAPLPEGKGGDAEQLLGLSSAEPTVDPSAHPGRAPSGTIATGTSGAAHRAEPLLPRNAELTRRYFGDTP